MNSLQQCVVFCKGKENKNKKFCFLRYICYCKRSPGLLCKNPSRLPNRFLLEQKMFSCSLTLSPSSSLSHSFAKPKWTRGTLDTNECLHAIDNNVCIHICNFLFFSYRVKKPDEFNRPRIPYSQRKIKARSSKFLSKKVSKNIFGAKIQIENLKNYCTKNRFI